MRRISLAALLAVAVAGCVDIDQQYSVNPDGSGKVAVMLVFAPTGIQIGNQEEDPEAMMKKAVLEEIEESEGVEAWKDVTYALRKDGKVEFKGTAYFRDIAKVKLHNQGVDAPFLNPTVARGPGGTFRVTFPLKKDDEEPAPGRKDATTVTKERARYQQMKPLMQTMLTGLKMRIGVTLPGRLDVVSCLKRVDDRSVELAVEGKKMFQVVDTLIQDDAWMKAQIEGGRNFAQDGPQIDDVFLEKVFGRKGPVTATAKGATKPLFNYAGEIAGARKAQAAVLAKLKPEAPPAPVPAAGGNLKSISVAGVRLVHRVNQEQGLSPLNSFNEGYTVSLIGELPGAVLSAKDVKVLKAVSDTGESLMPEKKKFGFFSNPSVRLSRDNTSVLLEVPLKKPSAGVGGIGELSGTFQYVVGGKTRAVNVGVDGFKAGVRGKDLGAEIESIEDSAFDKGKQELSLKLRVARETVESVDFFDAAGTRLKVRRSGYSSFNNQVTYNFRMDGKFPPKGKVVVNLYDDLKTFTVPFSVKDIDLLGRPRKK